MPYLGQTRSREFIALLNAKGVGECVARGELPPKRRPWFYDNGAFRDWRAGEAFDEAGFTKDVERMKVESMRPDFLVVPDVVGGGRESLAISRGWVDRLTGVAPLALAVQDGMSTNDVGEALDGFDVVFVGGSLGWKLKTGGEWVEFAHKHGRRCHVGRIGIPSRVEWAQDIGADSIDSAQPLWSKANLRVWLAALEKRQRRMFA